MDGSRSPERRVHELINDDGKPLENSFLVPDAALADVSAAHVERNSPFVPRRSYLSLERIG
jgi:hypothetical protein